jgi:predicted nucleic acid-binding protein
MMEAHSERVLPVDAATADEWGRLDARGSLPVVDGLLAATALVRGLTLVTRNVKDVVRTGVDVLDPFSPTTP